MDERTASLLRGHGWEPGGVLGTGMEGEVVDLSDDAVAKIWHHRSSADLELLQRFGTVLGDSPIPFRCSHVLENLDGAEHAITIERKVHGTPLRLDDQPDPSPASAEEVRLMGDALAGIGRARSDGLDVLPILPGEQPFTSDRSFGGSLAELVQRRFETSPDPLRRTIDSIDEAVGRIVQKLRELPEPEPSSLIHGDLIPANVMIADGEVSGVVDFGFLSTLGDPQFDAAIAASSFDMYGPNARRSENLLTEAFLSRFGHDPIAYSLYRAAYAVITNSYFDPDGRDGHFAWCADLLVRDDIRAAIA